MKSYLDVPVNRNITYVYGAALTFCVYDMILSIAREVKYIWASRWSPVKVLYFIFRYYGILNLIAIVAIRMSVDVPVKVCQRFYLLAVPGGLCIFSITVDIIMLLRIFALYERNTKVFITLLILILINFTAATYAAVTAGMRLAAHVDANLPSPWQGCIADLPRADFKFVLIAYVMNFGLSFLFLTMTVWKLVQNYQSIHGESTLSSFYKMKHVSPLLVAFVHDGSIFFALATITTSLGLVVPFIVHGVAQASFLPWSIALYSYSGAHLILSLRAAGRKQKMEFMFHETLSFGPGSQIIFTDRH